MMQNIKKSLQEMSGTPLDWFESWLLQRSSERENPLTPEAAEPYRYIWSSWCQWLLGKSRKNAEQGCWTDLVLQASPEDAMEFLHDRVKPATQRSGSASEISIVTRERYCMVLRGVHGHLMQLGLLTENPMKRLYELAGDDRPDAEVLPDSIWHHLERVARQEPGDRSPFALRDRALLWLMLDVALTPAELSALNLGQLDEALTDEDGTGRQISIRLQGNRAAQRRDLQLNDHAAAALQDWLAVRSETLEKGRPEALVVSELVFFTERRKPLSRRVLFHLTSKLIGEACEACGLGLPRHLGPLVLRNTAILHWLKAGLPLDEVLRRAGYQGKIALEHLRAHLPRP